MENIMEKMQSIRHEVMDIGIEREEHQLVIAQATAKVAGLNLKQAKLMRDMDLLQEKAQKQMQEQPVPGCQA